MTENFQEIIRRARRERSSLSHEVRGRSWRNRRRSSRGLSDGRLVTNARQQPLLMMVVAQGYVADVMESVEGAVVEEEVVRRAKEEEGEEEEEKEEQRRNGCSSQAQLANVDLSERSMENVPVHDVPRFRWDPRTSLKKERHEMVGGYRREEKEKIMAKFSGSLSSLSLKHDRR